MPYVGTTLNNLANLLKAQGQFAEAKAMYEECLKIKQYLFQKDSQVYALDLAQVLYGLGLFYYQTPNHQDREKSIELLKQVISIIAPKLQELPYLQQYYDTAVQVLRAWDFDVEGWLGSL